MSEILRDWGLHNEMMKLPALGKRYTSKTARKKAESVYFKYKSLIARHGTYIKDLQEECSRKGRIIDVLTSGKIVFDNGFLLVSEISSAKIDGEAVVVSLRNGTEQRFTKSFEFILELF